MHTKFKSKLKRSMMFHWEYCRQNSHGRHTGPRKVTRASEHTLELKLEHGRDDGGDGDDSDDDDEDEDDEEDDEDDDDEEKDEDHASDATLSHGLLEVKVISTYHDQPPLPPLHQIP